MTSIAGYSNFNSIHHAIEMPPIKKTKETFEQELQLAHENVVAEEYGFNFLPGISNLFFAPYTAYWISKQSKTSHKIGDKEGVIQNHVRFYQNLLAFAGAGCSVFTYGRIFYPQLSDMVTRYGYYAGVFGFVLCMLEAFCEALGLRRQYSFRNSPFMRFADFLSKSQSTIDKEPLRFIKDLQAQVASLPTETLSKNELDRLQYALKIAPGAGDADSASHHVMGLKALSSALLAKSFADKYFDGVNVGKVVALQRRVGTCACKDLDVKLKDLAKDAFSYNPEKAQSSAEEIIRTFQSLDQQAIKKTLIHIIGFLAAVVTAIAIIASLSTGIGTGVIAGIFLIDFLLRLARYLVINGVFSHEGWDFSLTHCLPKFLADRIDKQRETKIVPISIQYASI